MTLSIDPNDPGNYTVKPIRIKNRKMEWRDCAVCGQTFICRSDFSTFTCSHKCRMTAGWRTRRLHS